MNATGGSVMKVIDCKACGSPCASSAALKRLTAAGVTVRHNREWQASRERV
jgi:hypothetical protein